MYLLKLKSKMDIIKETNFWFKNNSFTHTIQTRMDAIEILKNK